MEKEIELTLGEKSNKDLADWFGVKEASFRAKKAQKLEELKLFADFYEEKGKVIITAIYEPVYKKQMSKTKMAVIEKVDETWNPSGLDSCTRVGTEIYEDLVTEDKSFDKKLSTVIKYTREGRNLLYGTPFQNAGKLGNCIYVWCKRDPDTGLCIALTEEERKIKNDLQVKYFGDATEKQILVKGMVEAGEIRKEDAWEALEELTNMKTSSFICFLQELQNKVGCQIIRGTLVDKNNKLE